VKKLVRELDGDDLDLLANDSGFSRYSFNARERNCLFANARGRRFLEAGYAAGIDADVEGRGVAVGDLDGDGTLDLVVRAVARQKIVYLHNELAGRAHYLRVHLVGTRSNRDAVGAVVRVSAGGLAQMRVRSAGTGFQGQSEATLHFGLGTAARVDALTVRWPSGLEERFADVPSDAVVEIVEGAGRYAVAGPAR
jgi:hypothetical protein